MAIIETVAVIIALVTFAAILASYFLFRRDPKIMATMQLFRARLNSQEFVDCFDGVTPGHIRSMATQYLSEGGGKPELVALGALVIARLERLNQEEEHQHDD